MDNVNNRHSRRLLRTHRKFRANLLIFRRKACWNLWIFLSIFLAATILLESLWIVLFITGFDDIFFFILVSHLEKKSPEIDVPALILFGFCPLPFSLANAKKTIRKILLLSVAWKKKSFVCSFTYKYSFSVLKSPLFSFVNEGLKEKKPKSSKELRFFMWSSSPTNERISSWWSWWKRVPSLQVFLVVFCQEVFFHLWKWHLVSSRQKHAVILSLVYMFCWKLVKYSMWILFLRLQIPLISLTCKKKKKKALYFFFLTAKFQFARKQKETFLF